MAARHSWRVEGESDERVLSQARHIPDPLLNSVEPGGVSLAASHLQTRQSLAKEVESVCMKHVLTDFVCQVELKSVL